MRWSAVYVLAIAAIAVAITGSQCTPTTPIGNGTEADNATVEAQHHETAVPPRDKAVEEPLNTSELVNLEELEPTATTEDIFGDIDTIDIGGTGGSSYDTYDSSYGDNADKIGNSLDKTTGFWDDGVHALKNDSGIGAEVAGSESHTESKSHASVTIETVHGDQHHQDASIPIATTASDHADSIGSSSDKTTGVLDDSAHTPKNDSGIVAEAAGSESPETLQTESSESKSHTSVTIETVHSDQHHQEASIAIAIAANDTSPSKETIQDDHHHEKSLTPIEELPHGNHLVEESEERHHNDSTETQKPGEHHEFTSVSEHQHIEVGIPQSVEEEPTEHSHKNDSGMAPLLPHESLPSEEHHHPPTEHEIADTLHGTTYEEEAGTHTSPAGDGGNDTVPETLSLKPIYVTLDNGSGEGETSEEPSDNADHSPGKGRGFVISRPDEEEELEQEAGVNATGHHQDHDIPPPDLGTKQPPTDTFKGRLLPLGIDHSTCYQEMCEKSHQVQVTVTAAGEQPLAQGHNATLKCSVKVAKNTSAIISWYLPKVASSEAAALYTTRITVDEEADGHGDDHDRGPLGRVLYSRLQISNISSEDNGRYTCLVLVTTHCCQRNESVQLQVSSSPSSSYGIDLVIVGIVCFVEFIIIVYLKTRGYRQRKATFTPVSNDRPMVEYKPVKSSPDDHFQVDIQSP